jgi:hypothetical protein
MFLMMWLGRFKILGTVLVNNNASNLGSLLGTEARILLLYSTREEARSILKTAGQMGLTGDKYVWIVTQSVIGSTTESPPKFPVGMLGKIFVVVIFSIFYAQQRQVHCLNIERPKDPPLKMITINNGLGPSLW